MYMNVRSDVLLSILFLSNGSWLMELFHSSFGAFTKQLLSVMWAIWAVWSHSSVTKSAVSIGCLAIWFYSANVIAIAEVSRQPTIVAASDSESARGQSQWIICIPPIVVFLQYAKQALKMQIRNYKTTNANSKSISLVALFTRKPFYMTAIEP